MSGERRERVRNGISLRTHLLLWQVGTVLFVVLVVMMTAGVIQWFQLRDAYMDRTLGVAQAVAELPTVRDAFLDEAPAESIQPTAELIREASNMTFVVVTDAEGIRYSHPNEERIGERVSSDPSAATSGEIFTGVQEGTLGNTIRAKVPVLDDEGEVIGQVSVGILYEELRADILEGVPVQMAVTLFVALVGGLSAILTARVFHRRTLGLDPQQIAGLLEGREAILHGSRDGVVAVDTTGQVVLINDAAREMLRLPPEAQAVGRAATELLSSSLSRQLLAADGTEQLSLVGERRVLVRADPVSRNGEPVGAVLVLRDHTELHETLTELEGAQSLMHQLQSQAHEFQNQLHVIDGLLELDDVPAAKSYVQRLSQGGELSPLDAQHTEVDAELEALLLVKAGAARAQGIDFQHGGLQLWPHAEEADISLRDDLLTIAGNLLDNALEATPAGGRMRLDLHRQADSLRMVMDDSGDGVPEELRARIFESGVTTKEAGRPRGFGLPLVQQIVERRQGQVVVGESPLGGARFDVLVSLFAAESSSSRRLGHRR